MLLEIVAQSICFLLYNHQLYDILHVYAVIEICLN
jgi:hypothetical protein